MGRQLYSKTGWLPRKDGRGRSAKRRRHYFPVAWTLCCLGICVLNRPRTLNSQRAKVLLKSSQIESSPSVSDLFRFARLFGAGARENAFQAVVSLLAGVLVDGILRVPQGDHRGPRFGP